MSHATEALKQTGRWTVVRGSPLIVVLVVGGCTERIPTTPTSTATATPSPSVNRIEFVSSVPSPGGVIRTGLPDPAVTLAAGVTRGLTMSFVVVSAVDRVTRFELFLEGSQNGVCLTNAAPSGIPAAPVIGLTAGVPQTITITELLLTSVCRYPNAVNLATARLMPASRADADQTPFHVQRFPVQYTVVQ